MILVKVTEPQINNLTSHFTEEVSEIQKGGIICTKAHRNQRAVPIFKLTLPTLI